MYDYLIEIYKFDLNCRYSKLNYTVYNIQLYNFYRTEHDIYIFTLKMLILTYEIYDIYFFALMLNILSAVFFISMWKYLKKNISS